ncbi:EF-hand domain-containing protein [Maridesulfovibrio sp.]|uniref:EF-hand domain-containing protein n=1 Tax=Maridesulfovibrio sp. TaxID=2795000 RepID=UPI0029C9BDE9|nr:EF-hand domain-containing protein [Maridesulfovibrio sp.]
MSVSGIGDSSVSSLFSSQMSQMKRPEDYDSSDDFVSSIIGDQDSDGDGQLSSSEAGSLSDIFSEIDSDGDGYLSQEEMVADLESRQQEKAMMGNMSVMMQSSEAGIGCGESSESSSSEESEEEYDEYDYNQDGVVTLDELQKAFANGDTSLAGIVGDNSDPSGQDSEESGQSGQSILQRMAMRAYEQQEATTSASELLGASA